MPASEPASASSDSARRIEGELGAIGGLKAICCEPLARHTSMGVGGPADWFIEVQEKRALGPCLALLREAGVEVLMLGGGSNTLFTESGFRGAVVHLGGEFRAIALGAEPDTLKAGAAAMLSAMMKFAQRQGLGGLEFGAGIPGTLGGALAGNAGAGGEDICSLVESVEVLDEKGATRVLPRGSFAYAYRNSELRNRIILNATVKLFPSPPETIRSAIDRHLSKRWEQPVGERSSGCMFKNPPGNYAGMLIEKTGLKGARVGGVRVSEKHANFMVNDGTARAEEIESLMAMVRERVREETGIELESEVRMIPPVP